MTEAEKNRPIIYISLAWCTKISPHDEDCRLESCLFSCMSMCRTASPDHNDYHLAHNY